MTSGGALLFGRPGAGLQPLRDSPANVRSSAWSPDGQLLAIAAADEVTVRHWDSGNIFAAGIPVRRRVISLSIVQQQFHRGNPMSISSEAVISYCAVCIRS